MSPFAWENDVVPVERGPEPGGLGGAYRAFGETLRGLRTIPESAYDGTDNGAPPLSSSAATVSMNVICTGPGDVDSDGVPDASDNCPNNANPGQEDNDSDGIGDVCDPDDDNDGYSETAEGAIGTADNDNCTAGSGPGPNTDAWPPDMDLSNAVNISDLVPFKAHFGATDPGDPIYDARFDLDVSGNINISDLVPFKVHFGMNCT